MTGGRITKVQMEHVWVEAAIDFQPSRGTVNRSADTWAALDPSYKQYEYLQGLDAFAVSGLDPNVLAESFANSGTVNTAEGWVSGFNPAILANSQVQTYTALRAHIENNMADATALDVIGGRRVVEVERTVLPTSLPARKLLTGARYATLPPALQNHYGLGLGIDLLGDVNLVATSPWARVNNHKLTLSFRPATAADEETLASLIPEAPLTDPSQLPYSIPSYLIYVVPEITLEDQVVARGSVMRLGEDLELVFQVSHVNHQDIVKTYKVPAGSFLALSANQGSVSPAAMRLVYSKLTEVANKLDSNDPSLLGTLTKQNVLGDVFHAGTLSYWGQYITLAHATSLEQSTKHNLSSGFGSIGYEPNVDYFFGFPRAITSGGAAVNVWVADVIGDTDGNTSKRTRFQHQIGLLSSSLENAVPEQFFTRPTNPVQGISAAKAIELAMNQGQRIYHITPANRAQTLPQLRLDQLALSEITNALDVGREVIAHTHRLSVTGWTGEGYILLDPATGAGAYKITGGNNGGFVFVSELYVNVFSMLLEKQFYEKLGPVGQVMKDGALRGAGIGLNFAQLLDKGCNPLVALALAAALEVMSNYITNIAAALALSGVGILAAIAIVVVGFLIAEFFKMVIIDIASRLCRISPRRNKSHLFA